MTGTQNAAFHPRKRHYECRLLSLGMTMGRVFRGFVAVALASVSGCSGDGGKSTWQAEDDVRAQLRDPASAEFSDEVRHPPKDGQGAVICGKVNSKNGFGGMGGARRFISGGLTLVEPEDSSDIGKTVFEASWKDFCSDPS
jgi:hypothetical protein